MVLPVSSLHSLPSSFIMRGGQIWYMLFYLCICKNQDFGTNLFCRTVDTLLKNGRIILERKTNIWAIYLSMSSVNLMQIKLLPQIKLDGKHWSHYNTFKHCWLFLCSRAVPCAQVVVMHVPLLYIAAQRVIYHKTTGSWLGEWGYIS